MKFEIKNRWDGKLIFEIETESWRLTIEAAIKGSADLRYADLRYADLRYANLSSADLSYANLRYANLSSANLSSANLRYANLRYADLRYADLRYANLSYADLRYADLRYANLSSADLSYANLRYANLSSANLSSANLRYANLSYADLRYADLRDGITITRQPLQIVGLYYPVTIWDEHMQIGCEFHSLVDWAGFSDEQILKMDSRDALKFWRAHKSVLLELAKSDGRGVTK